MYLHFVKKCLKGKIFCERLTEKDFEYFPQSLYVPDEKERLDDLSKYTLQMFRNGNLRSKSISRTEYENI